MPCKFNRSLHITQDSFKMSCWIIARQELIRISQWWLNISNIFLKDQWCFREIVPGSTWRSGHERDAMGLCVERNKIECRFSGWFGSVNLHGCDYLAWLSFLCYCWSGCKVQRISRWVNILRNHANGRVLNEVQRIIQWNIPIVNILVKNWEYFRETAK